MSAAPTAAAAMVPAFLRRGALTLPSSLPGALALRGTAGAASPAAGPPHPLSPHFLSPHFLLPRLVAPQLMASLDLLRRPAMDALAEARLRPMTHAWPYPSMHPCSHALLALYVRPGAPLHA